MAAKPGKIDREGLRGRSSDEPEMPGENEGCRFFRGGAGHQKDIESLGLWETDNHDPPPQNPSYIPEITYDDNYSQTLAVEF